MPRVFPSQVVAFIRNLPDYQKAQAVVSMNHVGSPALSSVLDLVAQVPGELLTMDDATYAGFILNKAKILSILETWHANAIANANLRPFQFGPQDDPLIGIRDTLAKCPDESPAPSTSDLAFITDAVFRANLRNDIGAINRALSNGEWKAATVLAGSVIEALLLWSLEQQLQTTITAAVTTLRANDTLKSKPAADDLDRWDLHEYTEVAAHLCVIKPDTAIATRLAKDFRNLIHPGRAQRLGQQCNRGTALSSVAALEHVVTDLI